MTEQSLIRIENLTKSFGESEVLRGISLDAQKGEFITLLGPSGCGKTTTLRIIAGLETPDSGRVYLSGRDVTELEPNRRNVNTVFQNYALFPHMNVARNIAYGLRIRGAAKGEINGRVGEMLDLIQLPGFEKRMPSQLSGGQRQRVAIARAVILRPDVLLLDEPLGALDLKLRQQMQVELKALQKRLGITFIYITHDQEEALNMSDRIAVMSDGRFEQVGAPEDIYERPLTRFVARFIGEGALIEGRVEAVHEDTCVLRAPGGAMLARRDRDRSIAPGGEAAVSVHAESIKYAASPIDGFDIPATVMNHRFAGSMLKTDLRLKNGDILTANSVGSLSSLPAEDTDVFVYWDARHACLIPGGVGA